MQCLDKSSVFFFVNPTRYQQIFVFNPTLLAPLFCISIFEAIVSSVTSSIVMTMYVYIHIQGVSKTEQIGKRHLSYQQKPSMDQVVGNVLIRLALTSFLCLTNQSGAHFSKRNCTVFLLFALCFTFLHQYLHCS